MTATLYVLVYTVYLYIHLLYSALYTHMMKMHV